MKTVDHVTSRLKVEPLSTQW